MVDKLHDYQGTLGQFHTIRDNVKSNFTSWKENNANNAEIINNILKRVSPPKTEDHDEDVYFSHLYRRKTQWELLRLCIIVAGIEFSYSAITAFSSPILLEIGLQQNYMSFVFSLSPILGFFLTPICGSLSDRCKSRFGRRRIFIAFFSCLELVGLFLIPYGQSLYEGSENKFLQENLTIEDSSFYNISTPDRINLTDYKLNTTLREIRNESSTSTWTIIITIVGVVIADHFADALQNPSRAYLLDVCQEDDHARGLSTFTILAGCGGTIGYGIGSINWDNSFMGFFFGGHIKTIFILTACLFMICVMITITTFREVPLKHLHKMQHLSEESFYRESDEDNETAIKLETLNEQQPEQEIEPNAGDDLLNKSNIKKSNQSNTNSRQEKSSPSREEFPTLMQYLSSIVMLPFSMRILLLTNILCWMSHVSYSLYFTDYVGEAIFNGNPKAPLNSAERNLYDEGVRFACQGMAIYSFSCMLYSTIMEKAIKKFGIRKIYAINLFIDAVSMLAMFYFNSKVAAVIFSFAGGVLYSTLFTIPYLLVAHYHALNVFELNKNGEYVKSTQVRGLGTDIAIIGSSVFIAQFFLSLFMGFIVSWYGNTSAVPLTCSVLSSCAFIVSTKIMYLDL